MAGLSLVPALFLLLGGLAGHGRPEPVARRIGVVGALLGLSAGSSTPTWWLGVAGLMVVGVASRPRATTRSLVFTQWLLAAGWIGAAGHPVLGGALGWLLMYRFAPSRALALVGLFSTGLIGAGTAFDYQWMVALGFAARLGLMPLHSWLLTGFEKGPTPVPAAFFASGLAVIELSGWPVLALSGLATMLAGAVMGTVQSNLRRAVGCLFLSQAGLLSLAWIWAPAAARTLVVLVALGTVTWALCAELVEVRYGEDPPVRSPRSKFRVHAAAVHRVPIFRTGGDRIARNSGLCGRRSSCSIALSPASRRRIRRARGRCSQHVNPGQSRLSPLFRTAAERTELRPTPSGDGPHDPGFLPARGAGLLSLAWGLTFSPDRTAIRRGPKARLTIPPNLTLP